LSGIVGVIAGDVVRSIERVADSTAFARAASSVPYVS
jgi:hypothetical protein